jgi:hypothetical protein
MLSIVAEVVLLRQIILSIPEGQSLKFVILKVARKLFSSRKFCSEHRYGGRRFETIGDLRAAAKYQVNAYARYFARNWARQNLDLTKCAVCDYRTHIEIAHIEPLAKFPDDTPIAETYINNVIGLCPNHHWEFDNGYLVLSALSESRTRMCPITVSIP